MRDLDGGGKALQIRFRWNPGGGGRHHVHIAGRAGVLPQLRWVAAISLCMSHSYDVFFSYSQSDAGIARSIVDRLHGSGLRCFLAERSIQAGEPWEPNLRDAIRQSKRLVVLMTPRSKNSLWVAVEAGAAWMLDKEIIAAVMFVDPAELIDPLRKFQARVVEAPDQVEALAMELAGTSRTVSTDLSGRWIDPHDGDTVFFRQVGREVLGFYDLGNGKRKVGFYVGTLQRGLLKFDWRWINGSFGGSGNMRLIEDGRVLSGTWWYQNDRNAQQEMTFRRVDMIMPSWVSERDFERRGFAIAQPERTSRSK